ncbi:MAG TPA: hypothetical protein VNZ58_03765 [Thermomicrobiales bacterium]|nr:hypothetical protein [Thermomicrobiales bacterium]
MPKRLKALVISLIALLTLGLAVQPAVAQPSPEQLLAQLDGLQTAYARKYIADREFGFATPVLANQSTPDILLITVLEFDTGEHATSAFDGMVNGLVARMLLGDSHLDLDETNIEALGDQALLYTGTADGIDGPEQRALLAVRDGNLGFLITTYGGDISTPDLMREIATSMTESTPGDGRVTVADGLATGSTFDMMPGRDDYGTYGLVPMYDYDLLSPGGEQHPLEDTTSDQATPASTPAA